MEILQERHNKIAELCLRVLGNMSINQVGKDECIENRVIERSYSYLIAGAGRSYEDALNTSLILMSCSIHLEGKNQIIDLLNEDAKPLILVAIIKRLQKQEFPGIRNNLKIVLTNVAELPRGFSDITNQILVIEKIDILDEVFGPRAVKPLHNFLPKLSDWDKDLELEEPDDYFFGQLVIKALSVLFKKY